MIRVKRRISFFPRSRSTKSPRTELLLKASRRIPQCVTSDGGEAYVHDHDVRRQDRERQESTAHSTRAGAVTSWRWEIGKNSWKNNSSSPGLVVVIARLSAVRSQAHFWSSSDVHIILRLRVLNMSVSTFDFDQSMLLLLYEAFSNEAQ